MVSALHYEASVPPKAHGSQAGDATDEELLEGKKPNTGKIIQHSSQVAEIVNSFRENLEKSKQLFHSLKDIPPYGQDSWKLQFGKTFEVHNFIWKMQQKYRAVLTERAGLSRAEIGEIASRIGQLYYQYYVRTSDVSYLEESFNFYNTLRLRNYFKNAEAQATARLMLKKLRFYTRYFSVLLLLGKFHLALHVMKEFFHFVAQFSSVYAEESQEEWAIVCSELQTFNQKLTWVKIISSESTLKTPLHIEPTLRLSMDTIPHMESQLPIGLGIGRVIISGSSHGQLKFNDMTLDMFRMVTCFEIVNEEATFNNQLVVEKPSHAPNSGSLSGEHLHNPIKLLLYQPNIAVLLSYISSAFKDILEQKCLVIYISGDESNTTAASGFDDASYDCVGICTNRRTGNSSSKALRKSLVKDANCLYPGDLMPFCRKPLFLIIECTGNTLGFLQMRANLFGEPFLCIISPQTLPSAVEEGLDNGGGLLTMFLSDPLLALCKVCGLEDVSQKSYTNGTVIIKTFYLEAARLLLKSKHLHFHILCFLSDQVLRMIILKFLFCSYALRLHRSFKNMTQWPRCFPEFPPDILDNVVLEKIVRDVSVELEAHALFNDSLRM